MLVALQSEGDADLALLCTVCKQPFRSLSEAYIGHVRPTEGPPLATSWLHKRCADGNLEQIFGATEVRLHRGDFALHRMLSKWQSYEKYQMFT
jgi:hypothetical protein